MVLKRPIRGDERQATIADPSADRRRVRMIRLLNSNDPTDAGPRLRHDDTPLLRLIARRPLRATQRSEGVSRGSRGSRTPTGNPGPESKAIRGKVAPARRIVA